MSYVSQPSRSDYLFADSDLGATLIEHMKSAIRAANDIPESRFRHQFDAEIVEELVLKFSVRPIELRETQRSMRRTEMKLDVSRDPMRNIFRDPGPIYVDGIRIVISTPFLGDVGLWRLRPSTYRTVFPRGQVHGDEGTVGGGTLDITIERPVDADPDEIKRELEDQFENIRYYIAQQNQQIVSENAQLERRLMAALAQRRQRLAKHSDLENILGIPMAQDINPPLTMPIPLTVRKMHSRAAQRTVLWDFFISHASEDKDAFARPLAEALRKQGYSVWFDEFALKVGDSLRRSIDKGLANCRFGVVIISPDFMKKEWPQKELDGLVAREVDGLKVILPVWHNIDRQAIVAVSPLLADRLATNSARGLATVVRDLIDAVSAT